MSSPLLRALTGARDDVPAALSTFDALARAEGPPSFEEYSARLGDRLAPWRETLYFDVGAGGPGLAALANRRFVAIAEALAVRPPGRLVGALACAAAPEVLQVVLGIDADTDDPRLKYYLVFAGPSHEPVERLRAAVDAPPLPPALRPGSVYILGLDLRRGGLADFKIYVRLDRRRVPRVVRNLDAFAELWQGSRDLVFQHCLRGAGRQIYFHASAASTLDRWLAHRAARDPVAAELRAQIERMNAGLIDARLRPWIASFPLHDGALLGSPSNVYFHLERAPLPDDR